MVALYVTILTQALFATPTAVSVWQGTEFSSLDDTGIINSSFCSLNINGNTVSPNGEIIVTGEHGVLLDWAQPKTSLTLLVWCTVPYVSSPSAIFTLGANSFSDEPDLVGTTIGENGDISGIWLGRPYSQGEEGSLIDRGHLVCLALRYDGGLGFVGNTVGGTDLFVVSDETVASIYHGIYLKRASARLYGASIGGTRYSGEFCSAAGMIVSKIALFDSFLDTDDILQAASGTFSVGSEESASGDVDAEPNMSSVVMSWGDDFSTTNENGRIISANGSSLSLNGNRLSADGSRIIVTTNHGSLVDWEDGKTNLTIMAWLGMPMPGTDSALITLGSNNNTDLIGVAIGSSGEISGIWQGENYQGEAYFEEDKGAILSQGETVCIALRYNCGLGYQGNTVGGTELMLVSNGVPVSVYNATYLKRAGEKIVGASIGGSRNTAAFASLAGCSIYRIAVYDWWLSDTQISQVASEVTLDASQANAQTADDSRYSISDSTGDRTIASIEVSDDIMLDTIVVKNGKVYDTILRIENTSNKKVKVSLPKGYTYETFKGMSPLRIPAHSINILTITRTADKVFLVSREELEVLK